MELATSWWSSEIRDAVDFRPGLLFSSRGTIFRRSRIESPFSDRNRFAMRFVVASCLPLQACGLRGTPTRAPTCLPLLSESHHGHHQDPMAHYWTAEQSRERAARCVQMGEETPLPKLKMTLMREADGWLKLAADQERAESRASQKAPNEGARRAGFQPRPTRAPQIVSRPGRPRAAS
jgi:hypothetical protein